MSNLVARTRWWVEDIHRKGEDTDDRKVRRVGGLGVAFEPEAVEVPGDLDKPKYRILGVVD